MHYQNVIDDTKLFGCEDRRNDYREAMRMSEKCIGDATGQRHRFCGGECAADAETDAQNRAGKSGARIPEHRTADTAQLEVLDEHHWHTGVDLYESLEPRHCSPIAKQPRGFLDISAANVAGGLSIRRGRGRPKFVEDKAEKACKPWKSFVRRRTRVEQ